MALVLVTPDDLRNRLQNPSLDSAVAQAAIDDAWGMIRRLARQTIDFVQGDVVELQGGDKVLRLPERPVVEDAQNPLTVEQLSLTNVSWLSVAGQGWYRNGNDLIRRWPSQWIPMMGSPVIRQTMPFWGPVPHPAVWPQRVRVKYSHGYRSVSEMPAGLADGLRSLIKMVAAQTCINPGYLRMERVGGVEVQYAYESMQSLTSLEDQVKKSLRALGLRRGGAFSVAMT